VSCLALLGRTEEALELFERARAVANDLGLFSEEYDTSHLRLVGNFPQAFTHVAFINAARLLAAALEGKPVSSTSSK
jgi:GH15 family glucan-1,4-alpha-glucosidase